MNKDRKREEKKKKKVEEGEKKMRRRSGSHMIGKCFMKKSKPRDVED